MNDITNNQATYVKKFADHLRTMPEEEAVKLHVGGIEGYYVIATLERRLLEILGFTGVESIVDIGCGSGRLAQALERYPQCAYTGIDVVPGLIDYCRRKFRQDWRFEVASSFTLPVPDLSVDIVTAFSLFTHLLHEEGFTYMRDACRALKSGGILVGSFLEYTNAWHQKIFQGAVTNLRSGRGLIVFHDREALTFFQKDSGFSSIRFIGGAEPTLDFPDPGEVLPDGKTLRGRKFFGQSVFVMRK
jgi:SAM-dependent methyltransferase